jgi:hypothetical protein
MCLPTLSVTLGVTSFVLTRTCDTKKLVLEVILKDLLCISGKLYRGVDAAFLLLKQSHLNFDAALPSMYICEPMFSLLAIVHVYLGDFLFALSEADRLPYRPLVSSVTPETL